MAYMIIFVVLAVPDRCPSTESEERCVSPP